MRLMICKKCGKAKNCFRQGWRNWICTVCYVLQNLKPK